ncbi:MAG: glutamine synthetase III, partial [Dysgonamonadaceae bacterium]|nr:glutamine synthetase III [Dysgonamonadaceae bacterium]
MSNLRFKAVEEAFKKKAVAVSAPAPLTSDYYGESVFNKKQWAKYLPKDTVKALTGVIEKGETLDRNLADSVAAGMKTWAIEKGATHYTHWFQPLTEGTAQKHDSFIEYEGAPGS